MMRKAPFLLLAAAVALTACSRRPDPAAIRAGLAQTDFSLATQPLIVADFRTLGTVGILGQSGINGTVASWRSPDGASVSLDRGIVVRTAGTGPNLLIADAAPTLAAMSGSGPRDYQRLYKHLSADNQIRETVMQCSMSGPKAATTTLAGRSVQAQEWTESCESGSQSITNRYWMQSQGMVKSDQWLSSFGGYLTVDVPSGVPR